MHSQTYRLPEHKRQIVWKELAAMLEMGVFEMLYSTWCGSIVLVLKKDGSIDFCVDHKVNEVSQFDVCPMHALLIFSHWI